MERGREGGKESERETCRKEMTLGDKRYVFFSDCIDYFSAG